MAIDGRSARRDLKVNAGPYEALVVGHLDPKRMGTLQVEILRNSTAGNQSERSGQIITVKYMSPFAGVTSIAGTTSNDDFAGTQKSYGMWMVPPDIGTKVIVMFAEGNIARGYWIGCVFDTYMNWMSPDPWAGSEYNSLDTTKKLPVGEFNKRLQTGAGTNPTAYPKPINTDFYTVLGRQGLVDDDVRGPTNSSSRRDVPSSVFGVSTPGPRDKRDGAPRGSVGPSESRTQSFSSRLGGSSIIMDDGDETQIRNSYAGSDRMQYTDRVADNQATTGIKTIPKGECMRFRTRTGHQILMHNSEDLIYIANAQGSTWIELTANGKIDIYAQDSVSVRTNNDINVSSDRDINMSAARDINFNAGRNYKLTVAQDSDVKVGVNHKLDVGADHDVFVGATQKVFVGAEGHLVVSGAHSITNKATLDINTTGDRKDTQANLDLNTGGYNYLTSGANTEVAAGGDILMSASPNIHFNGPAATGAANAGTAAQAAVAAPALWAVRVPTHEPYTGHEHLDPQTFTPARTQAISSPSNALYTTTPLQSTDADGYPTQTSVSAANVNGSQTVVPGQAVTYGQLPANPVAVNDMQRFFLSELIRLIGLDPAKYNKPANPANVAEGDEPGNAEALAMALGNVQRECGFTPHSENMNYSAGRLRAVFPSRVRSDAFAQELVAAGPAAIGNTLYGGRNGNADNEGYKYRGRGLIQLTFKDNYSHFGRAAGHPEIVENPELANDPVIATRLAVAYLKETFPARGGGSWSDYDFNGLGRAFEKAVGYGNAANETPHRIAAARGFYSKLINGELTPLASISPDPAGTNNSASDPDADDPRQF